MDAAPEEPHPRPTQRNVAMREGRCCSGVWLFFFFFSSRLTPMLLRLEQYQVKPVDSKTADLGQNSKFKIQNSKFKIQKKKVQNASFELNNIPYFSSLAHFIQTPNYLTLSHSVTHSSLALSVCLSASVSALRLPYGCETVNQTATQSLQTPKFSSISILWVVFNL